MPAFLLLLARMSNMIGLPPPHKPKRIISIGAAILAIEAVVVAPLSANLAISLGAPAGYGTLSVFYPMLIGTTVSIMALARANRQIYYFGANGVYRLTTFLFDWFDVAEIAVVPHELMEPTAMVPLRGGSSLGYLLALAVSYRASVAFTMQKGERTLIHVDPDELSGSGRLALLTKLARDRNPAIRVDDVHPDV